MRHVLIDNPKAVTASGDDEALVDLSQRAQVRKRGKGKLRRRNRIGGKYTVRVEIAMQLAGGRRTGGHLDWRRAEVQARQRGGRGPECELGQGSSAGGGNCRRGEGGGFHEARRRGGRIFEHLA